MIEEIVMKVILAIAVIFSCLEMPANATSYDSTTAAGQVHRQLENSVDLRCLSNPDCQVDLTVKVSSNGALEQKKSSSKAASDSDDFYCEQAIWERSPLSPECANIDIGLSYNGSGFVPDPNNELSVKKEPGFVFLHLIPATVGGLPVPWSFRNDRLIHSPDNVLKLSVDKLQDPVLTQFRQEWVDFFLSRKVDKNSYENAYASSDVQKKAREMCRKYAKLFS
jgi:hypothetical protein